LTSLSDQFNGQVVVPQPIALARELVPLLAGLEWGIGGSVLMWSLGLETSPRDLDVVTTAEHFSDIRERISHHLGSPIEVAHPTYQSRCFARFAVEGPVPLDLFADVRVRTSRGVVCWTFDPRTVNVKDGLPWMRPADWVELYSMFDRPQRASALRDYLANMGSKHGL